VYPARSRLVTGLDPVIKKVQSALALGGAEPGKAIVADLRAEAVAGLVPRAGVVHRDPAGGLQPGPQHLTGFAAEVLRFVDQQPHHLPFRDADTDRVELCHQPWHRDLTLVVLRQHETPQLRTEVARHTSRQWCNHRSSIRRHPPLAAIADRSSPQHKVLHHKVLVAFEA
jgi:hypothetical protein